MVEQISTAQSDANEMKPDASRRRIIVHLGFPKTGTTTIQGMLAANADRLGEGIAVSAKDDLTLRMRKYALRHVRTGLVVWKWSKDIALKAMQRQLDDTNFDTLIISDENMVGIVSDKIFDPKVRREYSAFVERFDMALSAYDVTYIIYTRDLGSWHRSAYNQAVKMRRIKAQPYNDWSKAHYNMAGPDQIIASLRDVLGDRLHVVRMEDEIGEGRLLGLSLLEHAGVTAEAIANIEPPPRKNESLPAAAIELLQLIYANPALRGRRYKFLGRLFAKHPEFFAQSTRRKSDATPKD